MIIKGNMAYRSNRSKNNYYQNKKKLPYKLEPGVTGFLCTCPKAREKDCVKEAYNLLNEFADSLFGSEFKIEKKEDANKVLPENLTEEDDIEASLAQEVSSLKAEKSQSSPMRRFQALEAGANGIVFIRSTVPDPVVLAHNIMTSLSEGNQRSRFLLRLLPVEVTCKAYINDITSACDKLFNKHFCSEPKTFAIVFNHRHNDSLKREELIEALAALVSKKNESHKADLKQPQLSILIDVIRSMCCISVVPDYYLLKKYNILELSAKEHVEKNEEKKGSSAEVDTDKPSVKKEQEEEEEGKGEKVP